MRQRLLALFFLMLSAQSAFSGGANPLQFAGGDSEPGDWVANVFLIFAAIFVTSLIVFAIFSSLGSWQKRLGIRSKIHEMFLGLRYECRESGEGVQTGYLRSLDSHSATMVAQEGVGKGMKITLDLSSLPGYTGSERTVDALVVGAKPLKGETRKIVDLRFSEDNNPAIGSYLEAISDRHTPH